MHGSATVLRNKSSSSLAGGSSSTLAAAPSTHAVQCQLITLLLHHMYSTVQYMSHRTIWRLGCTLKHRCNVTTFDISKSILNPITSGQLCQAAAYSSQHTHTFNGPISRSRQEIWYKKGKTNLDFTEARESEWQWHQLGYMQVCTSLQTDNHASTHHSAAYSSQRNKNWIRKHTEQDSMSSHLKTIPFNHDATQLMAVLVKTFMQNENEDQQKT